MQLLRCLEAVFQIQLLSAHILGEDNDCVDDLSYRFVAAKTAAKAGLEDSTIHDSGPMGPGTWGCISPKTILRG